jgi:hypothetical protein
MLKIVVSNTGKLQIDEYMQADQTINRQFGRGG